MATAATTVAHPRTISADIEATHNPPTTRRGAEALSAMVRGVGMEAQSGPSLRSRILGIYEEHCALHAEIEPLSALPSLADKTQEDLYAQRGKLTSLRTSSKRLSAQCEAAHARYRKLKPSLGKRPMLPSRRRKWNAARATWEGLQSESVQKDEAVEAMTRQISETEAALQDARNGCESLRTLEGQLDRLDRDVFDGPTPEYPSEDSLEAMHLILSTTARLLQAESERELRARPKLLKSLTPLQVVLAQLREALSITLDAGVPTDTKYTRQLLVNGSPLTVAKRITPLVQKAKTESGKGHTMFAEARGSQLLVRELPTLQLLDLNKLPSKASGIDIATSISERGIHAALEVSYGQSQRQVAHVKREIERSKRRSEFFIRRLAVVKTEIGRVKGLLRVKRREIVRSVGSGSGSGSGVGAENAGEKDPVEELVGGMDSAFDFSRQEEEQDQDGAPETQASTTTTAPMDESTMFEFKQDAAGNPISEGTASSMMNTAATSLLTRTDSEEVPTIRNPHLSHTDSAAAGPLGATTITRKSTEALRRIMKECVRECNAYDYDDELPGYNYSFS